MFHTSSPGGWTEVSLIANLYRPNQAKHSTVCPVEKASAFAKLQGLVIQVNPSF